MSNRDPIFSDGGLAGFRCFRVASEGVLRALAWSSFKWTAGVVEADAEPKWWNSSGLYAYKTLPSAIYEVVYSPGGEQSDFVFALVEFWGKAVEAERGFRACFAEIRAFIEPVGISAEQLYPYEALAKNYPGVRVIKQRDISSVIEEYGLFTFTYSAPPGLMQFLDVENDDVVLWPETAPALREGVEMLPPASEVEGESLPEVDNRLVKMRFEARDSTRYVIWRMLGDYSSRGLLAALSAADHNPEKMSRHRAEEE